MSFSDLDSDPEIFFVKKSTRDQSQLVSYRGWAPVQKLTCPGWTCLEQNLPGLQSEDPHVTAQRKNHDTQSDLKQKTRESERIEDTPADTRDVGHKDGPLNKCPGHSPHRLSPVKPSNFPSNGPQKNQHCC